MKSRAILAFLQVCSTLFAAELPVREGLLYHFSAADQAATRSSNGRGSIANGQPVDLLFSGGNLAAQPVAELRPTFVTDGSSAYLKFDGKDDFLSLNSAGTKLKELTIILLAAPRENSGFFSGFIGMNALGQNDYTSGLNLDFGPGPTPTLSILNVESAGATGFRDLLTPGFFNAAERPFGDFHVFTVRSKIGKAGTEVFLDGFKGGDRDRAESQIAMDQMVIGGRIYSNDGNQPPFAQGFFNGAIADVIIFDRALKDEERIAIEQALLGKTVGLNALLRGLKGHALEPVKDPPVVQMFVPGFTVHELPLKIGNLNNVRYRHDGKAVALGYDGRIHLLTDTDGDGLEDRSEFFWDKQTLRSPIGMALTPKDDPRGDGVFVASKGKVSFILDKDRDGRADEEMVIASGWPELFHGVDSLGLAVDPKDGSIYFGRGCANFVDAYLIDPATGKSKYRLDDERGTIQRISSDFQKREIVCTGVRFTCALAFNRHGDLFASEQEGATWLPNGNPFDELLHIQAGKHYGFPPYHPKHLHNVRDEPAVFEYGPQHQSTVGLVFNEGVNGGPHFGPDFWEGDAIVTGESRGKLYRTKLAKTPLGYVAQNHLFGSLTMLAVDACVTPAGDLLIACHSGPPDWGTGPAGEGRIFKVKYSRTDLPQPVHAWAAAPDEFRVAFDKPMDPGDWANAQKEIRIEAGEHVAAGDRFEAIRPGYQIVRDQMAALRRKVEVLGLSLTEDRRTLVLRIARQTEPVGYSLTLPLPNKWRSEAGISQHGQIDLALTLNGIIATATNGSNHSRTVLPHPSLSAAAEFTRGSAEHEAFLATTAKPGTKLSLEGAVLNSNPFVPAIQPGAKLDWDVSKDAFASKSFQIHSDFPSASVDIKAEPSKQFQQVVLSTVNPSPTANGLFLSMDDSKHPIATSRLRVPWASEGPVSISANKNNLARSDVRGNWVRGRRVFFGDGGCATCHTVRGEGMAFGPDLSNLVFRDRDSVWNDILQPSATINPDHTGTTIRFTDGTEYSGLIRTLNEQQVVVALPGGAQIEVPRASVNLIEPMKHSLMPAGIDQQLSSEQLEDLLTFLLTQPIEPATLTRTDPPPPAPRSRSEITHILGPELRSSAEHSMLRILLVAGPKDHGVDEHDYPLWLERWSKLLNLAEKVSITTSTGFPTSTQLDACDVAVFYNANPGWDAEKAAAIDRLHKRGAGVVYLHYAVDGGKDPASAAERVGLAFTLGSRFRHGEFDLQFPIPDHPITAGFPTLHFTDETYWNMRGETSRLKVLGTALEDGAPRPILWTLAREKSRIVGCIPGHYTWTFDDPLFRALVFRSICWAAKEKDVDRFADLYLIGARVTD